jgi:hypothetical protein
MRIFLAFIVFAACAFGADITGTWNAAVETDAGSGNPTFVLKQSGDEVTGHYSGALGEAELKGTVKGDKVEFRFKASAGGDDVEVVYSGTLEGDKKMKGTVKLGSLASGTFTAERK